MNLHIRLHFLLLAFLVSALPSRSARAQFDELLKKLPPGPNVLVMVNPKQIFASEVATQEGWKQRYGDSYAEAPLLMPPDAEQFVLASELDLRTMQPRWEVAVTRLASDPSTAQISRAIRGTSDTIAGVDAVATGQGGMIVKFGPRLFGIMDPGSRQAVARWVQSESTSNAVDLSPYLAAQAAVPDQVGTEIIMALDLTDALNRDRIRTALANSDVLKRSSIDTNAATETIAGLQGVTLGARVTRRIYGVLKLDFKSDTAPIKDVAKSLLLEVLDEAGASIDEFQTWTANVTPRRITLEGELTAKGLRRLFSFLDLDASSVASDDASAPSGSQANGPDAQKSLEYFKSIQTHLNDLRNEDGARSYGTIALWFDKYAKRIERMPILGVDKVLVDYGQFVVYRLRDAVDAIRGVGLRSGAKSAGVVGYSDYYVFDSAANYVANEVGAAEAQRREIRTRERAQGSTDARAIMREIEDKTTEVQRQMTERYQIEFGGPPRRRTQ